MTPQEKSGFKYRHAAWIGMEALIVLAVVMVVGIGALALRINLAPLDVGFAKARVEEVLRSPEHGTHAAMEQVYVHWPKLYGPLLLVLRDVKIVGPKNHVIVSMDEAALGVSKAQLLVGHIAPVALILRKPALRVIRRVGGQIDIGFSDPRRADAQVVEEQADEQTELATRILEYIGRPGSNDDATTPLGTLRAFEIYEAQVMVEDRESGAQWPMPRLDIFFKSRRQGLECEFYTELTGEGGLSSQAKGRFLMDWESRRTTFSAAFENFDISALAVEMPQLSSLSGQDVRMNAQIEAVLNANMFPETAKVEMHSAQGSFLSQHLSTEAVPYKDFALQASYDGTTKTLDMPAAQITLRDVTFKAEAEIIHDEAGARGPVKISIDQMHEKSIEGLWPEIVRGDNSEEWIVRKITDGTFHNIAVSAELVAENAEDDWSFDVQKIMAEFSFEGASVDYRPPMLPVANAKGHGTFDNDAEKLSITIESANIADLVVESAQLEFDNIVKEGAGVADIDVKLNGPLTTGFEYVSTEPIALKHGFDLSRVKGHSELDVNVKFPTTKNVRVEDVKVSLKGTLNDVFLPDVVKDMGLAGGPFVIGVSGDTFSFKGKGKLADRSTNITYEEFISSKGKPYSSKVEASLIADEELRKHMGIDLSEFLEGPVVASINYTVLSEGRSEATVHADLKPARLYATPFGYEKIVGVEGTASLTAKLKDGILTEVENLAAKAPKFSLEGTQLFFRQNGKETELASGKAGRLVIGETVGAADFEVLPSGLMKIAFTGPFFDLQPFLEDKETGGDVYDEPPMQVSIAADRLRAADGETLQYGKIYTDINEEGLLNQLDIDAIAGGGNVTLRYKPAQVEGRPFSFKAENAGATLRAFGLYDKMVGGTMAAYGNAIRGAGDRNLSGQLEINNFSVVNAPALARLLGAMSLPGMMELLGSEGISFSRLQSGFEWHDRKEGSMVVLKDGRTSGNSLGLTFDGSIDRAQDTMDINGTLVPLSGVNKLIANIPLIGDILSGGTGSVFAATYSMKGPVDDPQVLVNPLAALTPGILRRILFENN
jgi:hypothetical protein